MREEFGLGSKVVALYAGAHGVPNDLDTVLDAAKLSGDRKDIVYALVGDGREKARLVQRAKTEGIENVVFVPPQPKSRMPDVLAAADIGLAVLAPIDLFRTVYPNKVFDYMAAGRPIVLLIDGVARAVVEDAEAGRFSPPGDAAGLARTVNEYASDPELRQNHGRSGRLAVEQKFSRTEHGEALVHLVESVAKRP